MTNIADKKLVKQAEALQRDKRKQELDDIRTVLSNASGKRLMWRLLGRCHTFETVFNSDAVKMSYNAGQQDIGHFIMSEIITTDENLFLRMMKDNKKGNQ